MKGFDCSEEKGTRGEKMKQKWHKMTKMATHTVREGETGMGVVKEGRGTYGKRIGRHIVTVKE